MWFQELSEPASLIYILNSWVFISVQRNAVTGFIHVREMSRKFKFFKVREFSGNSVICQGKMKFCKNVWEFYILTWWNWNVWSRCICFLLFFFFFVKFIKFSAPILSGKFEFVSWKCQGIVREFLVSSKCMNSVSLKKCLYSQNGWFVCKFCNSFVTSLKFIWTSGFLYI